LFNNKNKKTEEEEVGTGGALQWAIWKESMVKEFKALQEMGVFELVKRTDLPKRARVVKTKWV